MTKTLRRWTIVGGVAWTLLASACGGDDTPLPPPEADKLVETNPVTNTVEFYAPNDAKQVLPPGGDAQKAAMDWLEGNKDTLGIPNPQDSFKPIATTTDPEDNTTSVKLLETAGGLDVWGIESVLHFDADGSVIAFDGPYIPNLDPIAKQTPKIDDATALAAAEAAIRDDLPDDATVTITPIAQDLIVYVDDDYGSPALARHVRMNIVADTFMSPAEAFVDAMDGHVIDAYVDSEMMRETAEGLDGNRHTIHVGGPYSNLNNEYEHFRDQDEDPGFGPLLPGNWLGKNNTKWAWFLSPTTDGPWDKHAVSAELNVHRAERYYDESFKWRGGNGKGNQPLYLGMHLNLLNKDGSHEWNAFAFCSDDGKQDTINFTDAAAGHEDGAIAPDVVAHEFTHLVTANNSKLVYRRQPGGINEAVSDIFAAFTEYWAFGLNDGVFLVGEATGKPLRDTRHPSRLSGFRFGEFPDNMDKLMTVPPGQKLGRVRNDNGYVHYNSNIVNNAWSLQTVGGKHDTTGVVVSKKTGFAKSMKLWWKTQRQLLTRRSQIRRLARVQSVVASRSNGRYDVHAVACSWAAVNALTQDWIETNLHTRCDGIPPEPEAPVESCDGKPDGVYCSTTSADLGYVCQNNVITFVKCNDGYVCQGAVEGQMIVSCADPNPPAVPDAAAP